MTIAPNSRKSAATASSALLRRNAARTCWPSVMPSPLARAAARLLASHEAGRLHQLHVARLFLGDPVGVLLALQRRGIEGALFHQLLPLGRRHHLGEQPG